MSPLARTPELPRPELSVVIPVYNEEALLEAHLHRITAWLDGLGLAWELILVDDGSTDRSGEIIRGWEARVPGIQSAALWPNRGRGAALRTGMERAVGEVVLTTEADLSWSFDCLARLIRMVRHERIDVAVASPHRPGGRLQSVPAPRVALSRYGNRLAGVVLGHGITMATGMTRAYRRSVLPQILSPRDGKEFHLDVLSRATRHGLIIGELPATVAWQDPATRRRRFASGRKLLAALAVHLELLGRHAARRWSRGADPP